MRRAGFALFVAVAVFGVTMIVFALSRNFWLSLALLTAQRHGRQRQRRHPRTLLQTRTPQNLLGRVSAVNQIFIGVIERDRRIRVRRRRQTDGHRPLA